MTRLQCNALHRGDPSMCDGNPTECACLQVLENPAETAGEVLKLRAALLGMWKWQRGCQELMPPALSQEVMRLLGDETLRKIIEEDDES